MGIRFFIWVAVITTTWPLRMPSTPPQIFQLGTRSEFFQVLMLFLPALFIVLKSGWPEGPPAVSSPVTSFGRVLMELLGMFLVLYRVRAFGILWLYSTTLCLSWVDTHPEP